MRTIRSCLEQFGNFDLIKIGVGINIDAEISAVNFCISESGRCRLHLASNRIVIASFHYYNSTDVYLVTRPGSDNVYLELQLAPLA